MKPIIRIAGFALLTGYALQANAGCGLTVTFDNNLGADITVLEVESKTTTGSWSSVHKGDFSIAMGKKVTKAIETTAGCTLPQHLRVKYKRGNSTIYKTKGPLVTAVDKKINIDFDN